MHVYHMSPIDHWAGWQHPADVFAPVEESHDRHTIPQWEDAWDQARELARQIGWEGDVAIGPRVSMLPADDFKPAPFIIAWKQSNNGSTFVASPFPLPWLSEYRHIKG